MRIFAFVDPRSENATLAGATAVLARAEKRRLFGGDATAGENPHGRWSLAELYPDEADFLWLEAWARTLTRATLLPLLEGSVPERAGSRRLRRRSCLGLLLLFVTSEAGRREATEGQLWQVVAKRRFTEDVRRLLFVGGQPSSLFKGAVESAASDFRLRHVVGAVGIQRWMDTVYLQFGFTLQGFRRSLPGWLGRASTPVALDMLLRGEMTSTSFESLWGILRQLRDGRVERPYVQKALDVSPWVLPEWHDDLVRLALVRPDPTTPSEEDEAPPALLAPPRLVWNGSSRPDFRTALADFSRLDLTEDRYDLRIDGVFAVRLVRQRDGGYRPLVDGDLSLPADRPGVLATLHDGRGGAVLAEPVILWPQDQDVVVFALATGERLDDAWSRPMDVRRPHALLVASDLEVRPALRGGRAVGEGRWMLHFIPADWPAELSVHLDGECLWTPALRGCPEPEPPRWARELEVSYLPDLGGVPDRMQVELTHAPDVRVRYVRIQGRSVGFAPRLGTSTVTSSVDLLARRFSQRVEVRVGLERRGERVGVVRRLDRDMPGLFVMGPGGCRAWSPDRPLTVEEAASSVFRIVPPTRVGRELLPSREWAVLEGAAWVSRPGPRWAPIRGLSGLGAPLVLRHGVYHARTPDLRLAAEVHRFGCVREVRFDAGRGEIAIRLAGAIEHDAGRHRMRLWLRDGDVVEARDVGVDGDTWTVRHSRLAGGVRALMVAYRDAWLGGWWAPDWSRDLGEACSADPGRAARVLYLFRLPVLSARHRRAVRQVAHAHGPSFLEAWLELLAPRQASSAAELVDAWRGAVRDLFRTWRPRPEEAEGLVGGAFGAPLQSATRTGRETLWRLAEVDPLLFGRVLATWLAGRGFEAGARGMLVQAYCLLAGKGTRSEADEHRRTLSGDVVRCMSPERLRGEANPEFLERGLLPAARAVLAGTRPVARTDLGNLEAALFAEPFRRLLALHVLEWLAAPPR